MNLKNEILKYTGKIIIINEMEMDLEHFKRLSGRPVQNPYTQAGKLLNKMLTYFKGDSLSKEKIDELIKESFELSGILQQLKKELTTKPLT